MSKILTMTTATQSHDLFYRAWQEGNEMTPKAQTKLRELVEKITLAYEVDQSATGTIMADTHRALTKTINRATVPDDMERIEYAPHKGPIYEFTGVVLDKREYGKNAIELCQTLSGSFVVYQEWEGDRGDILSRVDVCEAGDTLGVMDALNWSSMARTMAKKMHWNLRVEVE